MHALAALEEIFKTERDGERELERERKGCVCSNRLDPAGWGRGSSAIMVCCS